MRPISLRALTRPLPTRRKPPTSRPYAVQAPGAPAFQVFNRHTKWLQKERAASNAQLSRTVDGVKDEVARRLCERLLDINPNRRFPHVLDLGANACNIARVLTEPDPDPHSTQPVTEPLATRYSITDITCADSSRILLHRDDTLPFNDAIAVTRDVLPSLEALPYAPASFDAVFSSLSLHWINDLPSVLAQINAVLKPDAPFLAAMHGGDSLFELRQALQLAEQDRRGGVSTHTSPLADVRDMGSLLQRSGFALLTVDVDDIVVDYPDVYALMQDLQAMGESNAVLGREMGGMQRDVLLAADGIYRELHGNPDGSVPATFRQIYMIGWKEAPGQEKPLPRGSGQVNLKDVLEGGS
ncbi:S-adenosyl-L-methionine-dependent methyltransferase [Cryomyces antarcticus]|uniref:Methyltransferase type 11 domain-containing protein n=1 Tax=Cryomyces antarcticus TaxID=329879 RepID=A0ABR0KRP0_9PEZI|nr:hypothetical protein LTR60_001953 [Cryomyces antarcticus]KAK5120450.1 hypothetical protein LTR16_004605 [Cryomyces antarcticus]